MSFNRLRGSIPDIKNLTLIENISISLNELSGELPYLELPRIQEIHLSMNNFSGVLPPSYLPSLVNIDIENNRFEGPISDFMSLRNLESIVINNNRLTGSIPTFKDSASLRGIIAQNNFFDTLPESIPSNLLIFDVRFNKIIGTFPKYEAPFLRTIRAQSNLIVGPFPDIEALSLREINVGFNQLSSSLPLMNDLPELEYFDFSSNPRLYGAIPSDFDRYLQLYQLNLRNTNMFHNSDSFLPGFIGVSNAYTLEKVGDRYRCPNLLVKRLGAGSYVSLDAQYYSYSYCRCLPGYYGLTNICVQCPNECDCVDGVSVRGCYASPSVELAREVIRCPFPDACSQKVPEGIVRNSSDPISPCEEGYTGRVCSKCKPGYGKQGDACVKCEIGSFIFTTTLVVVLMIIICIYLFNTPPKASGRLSIFLFHIQSLYIIAPAFSESSFFFGFLKLSSSTGSLRISNITCLIGEDTAFYPVFVNALRLPFVFTIGAAAYFRVSAEYKNKVVFVCSMLIHTLYYSTAVDVFESIGCTLYDKATDEWYLNGYPWLRCDGSEHEYDRVFSLGIVVLILYVIGYPLYVLFIMRMQPSSMNYNTVQRFGFLFVGYRQGLYQWEVIALVRRLAFSIAIGIAPYDQPTIVYLTIFIILQCAIWIQHRKKPYLRVDDNRFQIISLYVLYFTFFGGLLASLGSKSERAYTVIAIFNFIVIAAMFCWVFAVPLVVDAWPVISEKTHHLADTIFSVTSFSTGDLSDEADDESALMRRATEASYVIVRNSRFDVELQLEPATDAAEIEARIDLPKLSTQ